jgi:uncharacterized protein DUF4251
MKNTTIRFKTTILLLFITMAALPATVSAQNKKADKEAQVKSLVEGKNFVFKAQTALPTTGISRQLTTDFDLRVTQDTIVSDLPYFGRAYSAPVNATQGPLQFTSTDFQYTMTNRKKGGWDIMIVPKDVQDPRQMALSITESGYASLTVTSTNRQPISFNGYITAKR